MSDEPGDVAGDEAGDVAGDAPNEWRPRRKYGSEWLAESSRKPRGRRGAAPVRDTLAVASGTLSEAGAWDHAAFSVSASAASAASAACACATCASRAERAVDRGL